MNSLLLSIIAAAALPTPYFSAALPLPMPTPRFEALPVSNVLVRLPGPRNHFRCSHCGRSDCLMFLGDHLRRQHGQSMSYLGRIGYRQLAVLHDNIHNANWKPPPVVKTQQVRLGCEGGSCSRPFSGRLFRNWRR